MEGKQRATIRLILSPVRLNPLISDVLGRCTEEEEEPGDVDTHTH